MQLKSLYFTSASLLALALSGTQIRAADVQSSSYDWSGSYIGVSGGMADHQARYDDITNDWFGATHDHNNRGYLLGLQGGHNWQNGPVVFGVEADFSFLAADNKQIYSSDVIQKDKANWMGTLRGRAGLGLDRTFLYVTGGLAVADFDRSWTEFNDVPDSWSSMGGTKLGVIGGIGIERALTGNLTLKSETLIAKFGGNSSTNPDGFNMITDDTVFVSRVGLNYRFGAVESAEGSYEGTPHDFSGAYVGASLGGHMATVSDTDVSYSKFGSTYDHLSYGPLAGFQAGYNIQNGAAVYGIEADLLWAGGNRKFDQARPGSTAEYTFNSGLNWKGALKARSGVAAGNMMMYVLGGLAFANYDSDVFDVEQSETFDASGTHLGMIVGGGMEYAISPNLTTRLEATYTAMSGDTVVGTSGSRLMRAHAQDFAVTMGVNYYIGDRSEEGSGAIAPTTDWSGIYAGLQLAGIHNMNKTFDRVYDDHGGDYDLPSFGAGAGVALGADFQHDRYVFGVVGDFAVASNKESDADISEERKFESELNWQATLRARSGLATGNSLIYLTGGLALADANSASLDLGTPAESFEFDKVRFGGVAGIGVEHKISENISLATEILYTRYLSQSDGNGDTCNVSFGGTEPCEQDTKDSTVTAKIGLNYRF
jgi:opacity protein-like surface antigen